MRAVRGGQTTFSVQRAMKTARGFIASVYGPRRRDIGHPGSPGRSLGIGRASVYRALAEAE